MRLSAQGNIVVLLVAMAMLYRHSKRREIKSEVYVLCVCVCVCVGVCVCVCVCVYNYNLATHLMLIFSLYRYWLKCFAALVVVMGLCWSVGTVLQDLSSTPLLQASTLCMAFQVTYLN